MRGKKMHICWGLNHVGQIVTIWLCDDNLQYTQLPLLCQELGTAILCSVIIISVKAQMGKVSQLWQAAEFQRRRRDI